jgi:hypothetical protein
MRLTTIFALGLALCGVGCDDDTTSMGGGMDMAASEFPTAPTIGTTQLDRMGRAGVNTALTDPFYTDATAHGMKQDAYNQAPESTWPTFAAQFSVALGVFDGLDGVCGNQPLASASAADGGSAGEYGTLAGILANDQLLLDTAVSGCSGAGNYLAVEVGVITGQAPASCGGRTPLDSAIDTTYAVLSGDLTGGVTDGVSGDADTANPAQLTTFPFLGAAN